MEMSSNETIRVFVIDDDPEALDSLGQWLMLAGLEVTTFDNAEEALANIDDQFSGVVISDIRMPEMDGMALLKAMNSSIPLILITGHGGISQAVEAMKLGAFDFIEKPYKPDRIVHLVQRAWQQRQVSLAASVPQKNNEQQEAELADVLIGQTEVMASLRQQILAFAKVNADIIIVGETGTGKELVARSLHKHSVRHNKPFMAINVAAIPENLLESELFGHEAGSFTSANKRQIGIFEAANQGTLFLDEIESMPMAFQIKLLRVLQEREVTRVGSRTPIPINVRIISASKENLRVSATQGKFREDLYYRLMVAEIKIPPLRERSKDIPLLFNHFLTESGRTNEMPIPDLDYQGLLALQLHDWPGNVRELRHTAERYLLTRSFNDISIEDLLQLGFSNRLGITHEENSLIERLEQVEKALISAELTHHQGNIKEVMQVLDLPRRTLNQKMQKYQLKREDFIT